MMKHNNSMFIGWDGIISAILVIVVGLFEPAYCQTEDPALLLQQTPPQGGTITPGVGLHNFALNSDVTLTAVPRPGYQFVYWLGDVSDPTANSTIAYLDAPKIIIAIFERIEYDFPVMEGEATCAPGQRLYRSAADYSRRGYQGGGAKRPSKWRWPVWPEPPEPEPEGPEDFPVPERREDFPIPGGGDEFPVPEPIPEPATVVLLGLGTLGLIRRARKQSRHGFT